MERLVFFDETSLIQNCFLRLEMTTRRRLCTRAFVNLEQERMVPDKIFVACYREKGWSEAQISWKAKWVCRTDGFDLITKRVLYFVI